MVIKTTGHSEKVPMHKISDRRAIFASIDNFHYRNNEINILLTMKMILNIVEEYTLGDEQIKAELINL